MKCTTNSSTETKKTLNSTHKANYYRRYIAKKHEGPDAFELHSRKPKFYLEMHVYLSGKAGKKNVHHHLIIIIIISMLQGTKRTPEFAVEIIKQQQKQ
jgi:hypothetical protein